MSTPADIVAILRTLGLTQTECFAYIALVEGGAGTGYEVARRMSIARANAYAALEALAQRDLVEREAGDPIRFDAVTPSVLVGRLAADFGSRLDQLQIAFDQLKTKAPAAEVVQERLEGDPGARAVVERIAARARRAIVARLPPSTLRSFELFARGLEHRGISVDLSPSPGGELGYVVVDGEWAAVWVAGGAGLWGNTPFLVTVARRLLSP